MDKGPAERFLETVKAQKGLVAALERDCERIRAEVISLRSPALGERVQSSRKADLSDAVIRLEDAERNVSRELKRLIRLREEAQKLIAREAAPKLRAVLYSWYIMDETMATIAGEMDISERHVRRMKQEAIRHLEKLAADLGLIL